jgi:hypothetical protein
MSLDDVKVMLKKNDCENIIKIKAFSYKINGLKHITRFYIIMEQYSASLKIADEKRYLFNNN